MKVDDDEQVMRLKRQPLLKWLSIHHPKVAKKFALQDKEVEYKKKIKDSLLYSSGMEQQFSEILNYTAPTTSSKPQYYSGNYAKPIEGKARPSTAKTTRNSSISSPMKARPSSAFGLTTTQTIAALRKTSYYKLGAREPDEKFLKERSEEKVLKAGKVMHEIMSSAENVSRYKAGISPATLITEYKRKMIMHGMMEEDILPEMDKSRCKQKIHQAIEEAEVRRKNQLQMKLKKDFPDINTDKFHLSRSMSFAASPSTSPGKVKRYSAVRQNSWISVDSVNNNTPTTKGQDFKVSWDASEKMKRRWSVIAPLVRDINNTEALQKSFVKAKETDLSYLSSDHKLERKLVRQQSRHENIRMKTVALEEGKAKRESYAPAYCMKLV